MRQVNIAQFVRRLDNEIPGTTLCKRPTLRGTTRLSFSAHLRPLFEKEIKQVFTCSKSEIGIFLKCVRYVQS